MARLSRNLVTLITLMSALLALVLVYGEVFQLLMRHEGQRHSWFTGVYWTMQTMSTLGYGDIVFHGDRGRFFSMVVLATGITVLFVFLPFTLIQFFYAPWLEARAASRAPRELPSDTTGHVILTAYGPIEVALIERLNQLRSRAIVIVPDVAKAVSLHDQGVPVMVGQIDDADTYRRARVDRASLVATTQSDAANANVALSVRAVSATVPVVATAEWESSVELLKRAGCNEVVQLGEMLGRSMAVRIAAQDGRCHLVGQLDDLLVAEAAAANTALVGHALRDLRLRERFNIAVAGVWERGRYLVGAPEVEIREDSVLLLSGSRTELDAYNRAIQTVRPAPAFVLVIGGGRVGRATAHELALLRIDHQIVDASTTHVRDRSHLTLGDASDPDVLREAGIGRAAAVAITTRDDDANVYLTLQCRQMRPEAQILSRVTHERNIQTLYKAGADVVLSYFPMEANAIFGVLRQGHLPLLAEGLDLFTVQVPRSMVGRTLAESELRLRTGCTVLAVRPPGGQARAPDPSEPLAAGAQLMLIGDRAAAKRAAEELGA